MSQNGVEVNDNSLGQTSQGSESLNNQGSNPINSNTDSTDDEDDDDDNEDNDNTAALPVNNTPVSSTSTTPNKVSKVDLAKHNKQTDCWVGYNGKVYDISTFLPKHPGSAGAIAPYCGTADEFKKAFERKHGTSKVSTLMKVGVFIGDFDVMGEIK